MIDKIIKCLRTNGVERIVYTSKHIEAFFKELPEKDVTYIEDARSAVFNAYGITKINKIPTVVFVEDPFLPSTYTGLTEAWFQRVNVIVIAVNCTNLESSAYLNRCVDEAFLINENTRIDSIIKKAISHCGPVLLKIKQEIQEEPKIDYSRIIHLYGSTTDMLKFACYNSLYITDEIENIPSKYKYGVISKYIGQIVGGRHLALCIPEELLALDSNVFNIRNLPSEFKLFVMFSDGFYWNKFRTWIDNNGVHTFVLNNNADNNSYKNETCFAVLVK